jgi:hypothetical protein
MHRRCSERFPAVARSFTAVFAIECFNEPTVLWSVLLVLFSISCRLFEFDQQIEQRDGTAKYGWQYGDLVRRTIARHVSYLGIVQGGFVAISSGSPIGLVLSTSSPCG